MCYGVLVQLNTECTDRCSEKFEVQGQKGLTSDGFVIIDCLGFHVDTFWQN